MIDRIKDMIKPNIVVDNPSMMGTKLGNNWPRLKNYKDLVYSYDKLQYYKLWASENFK